MIDIFSMFFYDWKNALISNDISEVNIPARSISENFPCSLFVFLEYEYEYIAFVINKNPSSFVVGFLHISLIWQWLLTVFILKFSPSTTYKTTIVMNHHWKSSYFKFQKSVSSFYLLGLDINSYIHVHAFNWLRKTSAMSIKLLCIYQIDQITGRLTFCEWWSETQHVNEKSADWLRSALTSERCFRAGWVVTHRPHCLSALP